jgi:hypothetical protein
MIGYKHYICIRKSNCFEFGEVIYVREELMQGVIQTKLFRLATPEEVKRWERLQNFA